MKKIIVLTMIALFVLSLPAMAAKVLNVPICHEPICVYQAYCGLTCPDDGSNQWFLGFNGLGADVIKAVPGVLAIDPGGTQPAGGWPNFVSASQAGISWTVTNVALKKVVPVWPCTVEGFGGQGGTVQGSDKVRLWWPLMYELPGTNWTLTVSYKTLPWIDPANNELATTHQDVWKWQVCADLEHLLNLVDLFHQLPVGSLQVPIINGEALYNELICRIEALMEADPADPQTTADFFDLDMLIENSCATVACGGPAEIGIRNTTENPACCKLQADVEYIMEQLGVLFPNK